MRRNMIITGLSMVGSLITRLTAGLICPIRVIAIRVMTICVSVSWTSGVLGVVLLMTLRVGIISAISVLSIRIVVIRSAQSGSTVQVSAGGTIVVTMVDAVAPLQIDVAAVMTVMSGSRREIVWGERRCVRGQTLISSDVATTVGTCVGGTRCSAEPFLRGTIVVGRVGVLFGGRSNRHNASTGG